MQLIQFMMIHHSITTIHYPKHEMKDPVHPVPHYFTGNEVHHALRTGTTTSTMHIEQMKFEAMGTGLLRFSSFI